MTNLCVHPLKPAPVDADSWLQDNAALAMIERSADAWDHNQFKDVIVRVANVEMWVPVSSCRIIVLISPSPGLAITNRCHFISKNNQPF